MLRITWCTLWGNMETQVKPRLTKGKTFTVMFQDLHFATFVRPWCDFKVGSFHKQACN